MSDEGANLDGRGKGVRVAGTRVHLGRSVGELDHMFVRIGDRLVDHLGDSVLAGGHTVSSARGAPFAGAYAERIAAGTLQVADMLGTQNSWRSAGRVCSTAFDAVAVCTSSTGLAWP